MFFATPAQECPDGQGVSTRLLGLLRVTLLWPGKVSRSAGACSNGAFDYGGGYQCFAERDPVRYRADSQLEGPFHW